MRARFLTILAVFGAAGLVMTSIAGVAAPRLSASSGKAHVMTELIARAGDAQLTPLADGRVSVDERIEAAENTAQCLRDAGILVEMTPARGSGTFRFGGGSYEEQQRANAVYDDCYGRFQREIDMVHALQQPSLTQAQLGDAEASVIRCLQSRGVDVADGAKKDVWWEFRISRPVDFGGCADLIIAEFGALP
jgi:hypothetical protein